MLQQIVNLLHIVICFAIIGLVLIQHGKGAEVGASFGSGGSQTLFGSQGSTSFLAKFTWFLAIALACTSITLGFAGRSGKSRSVTANMETPVQDNSSSNSTSNVPDVPD